METLADISLGEVSRGMAFLVALAAGFLLLVTGCVLILRERTRKTGLKMLLGAGLSGALGAVLYIYIYIDETQRYGPPHPVKTEVLSTNGNP